MDRTQSDPWGQEYILDAEVMPPRILSKGPDTVLGTADDIVRTQQK